MLTYMSVTDKQWFLQSRDPYTTRVLARPQRFQKYCARTRVDS